MIDKAEKNSNCLITLLNFLMVLNWQAAHTNDTSLCQNRTNELRIFSNGASQTSWLGLPGLPFQGAGNTRDRILEYLSVDLVRRPLPGNIDGDQPVNNGPIGIIL